MNFQLLSPALNPNKSVGPNSIPTKTLKLLNDEISSHLSESYSLFFLSVLKTVKVIPAYQKDSKFDCSNHCPISLLPNIDLH